MRKTTAVAHPNIALIKYWGKRDEANVLPHNDSVSITFEGLSTKTTLEASDRFSFTLDGRPASMEDTLKVKTFLSAFTEDIETVRVTSENTVPTGAGFASSAAAFSALGIAADRFFATNFPTRTLESIVRKGSGSAARSLHGGAVRLSRDGRVYPLEADLEDFALIPVVIDDSKKAVSSREAMKRAVETSPFHATFSALGNEYADALAAALENGDFTTIGRLSEHHAHAMHATMVTSQPPLNYLRDASFSVMATIRALRDDGVPCFYTMDAGPNVKILTRTRHVKTIRRALNAEGHSLLKTLMPAKKGAQIVHDED